MTLLRLNEIDPRHQRTIKGKNIRQFQIYSNQGQPIGHVVDALLNDAGQFYYLIATLQLPRNTKQVLISIRETRVAFEEGRVYLTSLTEAQIEQLPTYSANNIDDLKTSKISNGEGVSSTSYSDLMLEHSAPLETSMPLESVTPLEAQVVKLVHPITPVVATQSASQSASAASPSLPTHSHSYDVLSEQTIQLLEERLFVDRHKRKVGEVIVRKVIETQIVEIPIRREKLIVEQISPEHKQLASIDLAGGEIDGLELAEIKSSPLLPQITTLQAVSSQLTPTDSTVGTEFSSIEAAIEFLNSIATPSNSNIKRVQIQLMT